MKEKSKRILQLLEETYKGLGTALNYKNPFELLVATILSAQSTDNQVNKITRELFIKYPTPKALIALGQEELAQEIKGVGLYKNKARNILATAKMIEAEFGGQVPREREELMKLPGVGRKTANVVMANAFGLPALGVDTHVLRVANRLGLTRGKNPLEVEEQLMKLIPREKWAEAHHWLIWHGRKECGARKPLCQRCPVNYLCPGRQGGKPDEKAD